MRQKQGRGKNSFNNSNASFWDVFSRDEHDKSKLPSFSGVLEVRHSIPGRMRLWIPSLKGDAVASRDFQENLSRLRGVRRVDVNVFLGTCLVEYDARELTAALIVAAASRCFDFERQIQNRQSTLWQEMKTIRFALDQALLRRTFGLLDLRSAMTLFLSLSLARGVVRQKNATFPPINMIWWLFQSIDR